MARSDGTIYIDVDLLVENAKKKLNDLKGTLETTSEKFTKLGGTLTKTVTAPLLGVVGASAKVTADFDSQMSKVKAVSGATEKEFESLRNTAKDLGETTSFSASQAAEGMEYLALAGWKTDDIMSGMPGLLNLAAAGAIDLGRAADITSDTMSSFGIEAENAAHVSDVFAYAQSNANTNVEQMGEAMKYLAPTANSLKWGLEETSAVVMTLADSGLKGSVATQAFSSSLLRLSAPTKQASKEMDRLGMNFFDAEGQMKSMPEVIAEMEKGLEGMTDKQKASTLKTLVGAEAYKQWSILLEKGSDSLQGMTTDLENSTGAAQEMADVMLDNLGGDVTLLKSALEGLAISIGELLTPFLRTATQALTSLVGKFTNLPDSVKIVILAIAGVAAAIGPLLLGLGMIMKMESTFTKGLNAVTKAVGALSKAFVFLATNPIGWIILGITALIAIGVLLYKNWDEIVAWCKKTWETLATFFTELGQTITDILTNTWQGIKEFSTELWGSIVEVLTNTWTGLTDFLSSTWTSIKDFFITTWNNILEFATAILTSIKDFFTSIWTGVLTFVQTVWNGIQTTITTVLNAIKTIITTVLTLVVNIFTNYVQAVALILQGMKNIFFAIFNGITQIITSTFNVIKGVITTILTGIKNYITLQLNYVKGTFQNVLAFIKALVTLDFRGMWNAIKSQMTLILSTVKGIWQTVIGVFKGINLFSVGADLMRGLLNGIKSMFSGIIGAVTDVASGIKNKITGFFKIKSPSRVTTELGQFIGEGVAVGITDMKGAVDRSAEELSKAAKPEIEPIDMPSLNVLDFNAEYNKRSVRGRTPQEDAVYSTEDETGKGIVIHIDKMEVRDDEDIVKVSRELESRIRRRRQSKGTA